MRRFSQIALWAALAVVTGFGCGGDDESAEDIVQKGCELDSDCPGGRCIEGLPGGLCTKNCSASGDCPDGTVCADTEATDGVCLFRCTSSDFCREQIGSGYVCDEESDLESGEDVRVCIDE